MEGNGEDRKKLMDSVFGTNLDADDSDDDDVPTRPARRTGADSEDSDGAGNDGAGSLGAGSESDAPPVATKAKALGGGRLKKKPEPAEGGASDQGDDDDDDDDDVDASPRERGERGGSPSEARHGRTDIGDIDDDDFIDDRGSKRPADDDDDVIRTEGGLYVDADDIEARPREEEDEEPDRPKTAYEEGIERAKRTRRTRRKEADITEIDGEVVEFLRQMMQAHGDDVDAYEKGEPAMNKLRMLPAVRHMFIKHEYREALLDRMVLAVLKCWLEPMSDSALPNIEIRTLLLEILASFRVDSNWVERLESSQGLGKVVNYLSIKDEHPPNQLIAKKLLKNWARPFYDANDDFHDLRNDFEHNEGMAEIRRSTKKSLAQLKARNEKKKDLLASNVGRKSDKEQIVAMLPEKSPLLFTRMAESEIQDRVTKNRGVKRKAGGSGSRSISKRFNALKNKSKGRGSGAQKPSLNGR